MDWDAEKFFEIELRKPLSLETSKKRELNLRNHMNNRNIQEENFKKNQENVLVCTFRLSFPNKDVLRIPGGKTLLINKIKFLVENEIQSENEIKVSAFHRNTSINLDNKKNNKYFEQPTESSLLVDFGMDRDTKLIIDPFPENARLLLFLNIKDLLQVLYKIEGDVFFRITKRKDLYLSF